MRRFNSALSGLRILLLAGIALLLVACNGGGSSSTTSTTSTTLSGTAAIGAPIDGYVYVVDANGTEVNTATNATTGAWIVSVSGMTAPFMIKVVANGTGEVFYSYADAANITVNVTPLTHLALFLALNNDLDALYTNWATNNGQLTAQLIANAQAIINANFAAEMDGEGLDHTVYDFFGDDFTADGTGIDALLDSLSISIDFTGGTYTIIVGGNAFNFDEAIDTTGIDIGGATGGGGGNGGACSGSLLTFADNTGNSNALYTDGQQVCFTASTTALTFSGKTLSNPTVNGAVTAPYSAYIFTDSGEGVDYEVVFNAGALHEINLTDTAGFVGQFN